MRKEVREKERYSKEEEDKIKLINNNNNFPSRSILRSLSQHRQYLPVHGGKQSAGSEWADVRQEQAWEVVRVCDSSALLPILVEKLLCQS